MSDLLRKLYCFGVFVLIVGGLWFVAGVSADVEVKAARPFRIDAPPRVEHCDRMDEMPSRSVQADQVSTER